MSTVERARSTYGGLRGLVANASGRLSAFGDRAGRRFQRPDAEGALCRSLIIVIAPIVILQSVVAYVFMERHWQLVTHRLSAL